MRPARSARTSPPWPVWLVAGRDQAQLLGDGARRGCLRCPLLRFPQPGDRISQRRELREQRQQLLEFAGLRDLRGQQQPTGGA
jgi:hypothetical protein